MNMETYYTCSWKFRMPSTVLIEMDDIGPRIHERFSHDNYEIHTAKCVKSTVKNGSTVF